MIGVPDMCRNLRIRQAGSEFESDNIGVGFVITPGPLSSKCRARGGRVKVFGLWFTGVEASRRNLKVPARQSAIVGRRRENGSDLCRLLCDQSAIR